MDTISHALWGKGLFGYRKYRWLSILFGIVPDILSFGVYFLFNLLTSNLIQTKIKHFIIFLLYLYLINNFI